MSSIPGPIIIFKIDAPQTASATQGVFQEAKAQARAASQSIADDWKRMAAQIRASIVQGTSTDSQVLTSRRQLVSLLDQELSARRNLSSASSKELATYRAMTLELERQKSFLKGTGGLTAGTANALNQVSTQTALGIERVLDSLVNRYFGGAAGAALRTVRDVGYYSAQAQGSTGGSTGVLGGLFSPRNLAIAGSVGGLALVAAGMTKMAVAGGKLAVELNDMAEKTGLSVESVVKLKSAAETIGVNFDSLSIGFKKFDTEITAANAGNAKASELFKALGVDVKKAAQDPFSAIQQLARVLNALPDPTLKVAVATQLFGRGGQQILPVLGDLSSVMGLTKRSSEDLARTLGSDVKDSAIALKAQMVNWKNETDALEVALGQKLLPTLVRLTNAVNLMFQGPGDYRNSITGQLAKGGQQLTSYGQQRLSRFLATITSGQREYVYTHPQGGVDLFNQYERQTDSGNVSKLFEAIKSVSTAAAPASDEVKKIRDAVAGLGRASRGAAENVNKIFGGAPSRIGQTQQEKVDAIINGLLYPSQPIVPPNIANPTFGANPLAGIIGTGSSSIPASGLPTNIQDAIKKVSDDLFNDTATREDKIKKEYADELDAFQKYQDQYPQYAQQISDAIVKIKQDEAAKLAEIYKSEADSLFNDLIAGHTRQFGKQLQKDIENILLAPVKTAFSNVFSNIFSSLTGAVNSTYGGIGRIGAGSSASTGVPSGSGLGGIFGSLGGIFGPVTPPFIGNFIGGHGSVGGSGSGQFITQTMYVSAGTVSIGGFGIGGGSGSATSGNIIGQLFGSGSGSGSVFGLNTLFGSGSSSSSGGSSSGGGIFGALSGIWGTNSSSSSNSDSDSTQAKIAKSLGVIGGTLLMAVGARQGGALGGFEGAAGGAISGFAVGGPVGAIVGALVGGITGALGGPNFQQRVATAMWKQQYNAPPSETFSFASNGSIANTLGTGFSQSGRQFGMFGLPSNTPFYASAITGPLNWRQQQLLGEQTANLGGNQPFGGFNPNPYSGYAGQGTTMPGASVAPTVNFHVNAIDAQGVAEFLQTNREAISHAVVSTAATSSSGFGNKVRQAATLP